MSPEEIRDIALDSVDIYLQHLEENGKGIDEIKILELEHSQKGANIVFKLRLSKRLRDTETIYIKNLRNNEKYQVNSDIFVVSYDEDENTLLIYPDKKHEESFLSLTCKDIVIIIDFKFLVTRVGAWYQRNGASISLPKKKSLSLKEFKKIDLFSDATNQPSENQRLSIQNIFTNPFSYIWGAPGTGKTRFVLSLAALHYVKNNQTIAILAPTNNSLEQVLRGVIEMTDKAGIPRQDILRLGIPTKKFAEEYPEVCEVRGLKDKIDKLIKKIVVLQKQLQCKSDIETYNQINTRLIEFEQTTQVNLKEIENDRKSLAALSQKILDKEIEIKLQKQSIESKHQQIENIRAKTEKLSYKILNAFLKKVVSVEAEIESIENKMFQLNKDLEYFQIDLSKLKNESYHISTNIEKNNKALLSAISQFKNDIADYSEVNDITDNILPNNISYSINILNKRMKAKAEKIKKDKLFFDDYENKSIKQIQSELDNAKSEHNRLTVSYSNINTKSIKIIACTLDTYIGRFTEEKLKVQHIFLDEAGYANMIKATTLFNHKCPITFLGDHKQLPPVCEINDRDIKDTPKYRNMFLWAQSAIFTDTLFYEDKETCLEYYLANVDFKPTAISQTNLNDTYRFGENLSKILGQYVYTPDFRSANKAGNTNILWVNARKIEPMLSRVSSNEVSAIKKIVQKLRKSGHYDFAVLTPYKRQLALLNNELPRERNELKLMTVHSSQGREWDTVILSVVDTSDKWFVDSTQKLSKGLNLVNTAVSRAKRNLIIVCDKDYWINQQNQLITEIIKCGEEYKF